MYTIFSDYESTRSKTNIRICVLFFDPEHTTKVGSTNNPNILFQPYSFQSITITFASITITFQSITCLLLFIASITLAPSLLAIKIPRPLWVTEIMDTIRGVTSPKNLITPLWLPDSNLSTYMFYY